MDFIPLKGNSSNYYTLPYRPNVQFFERQTAQTSEIRNGSLGLYGTEHSKCSHVITLSFEGLFCSYNNLSVQATRTVDTAWSFMLLNTTHWHNQKAPTAIQRPNSQSMTHNINKSQAGVFFAGTAKSHAPMSTIYLHSWEIDSGRQTY